MGIKNVIDLLGTMFERLEEVDKSACASLMAPHVIESQEFLIKLQEAIDKLDPTEIVETDFDKQKFVSIFNYAREGNNGKSYWQRKLNDYVYVICADPDNSNATTISVYLKDTDADNPAFSEDSEEYKKAMALYKIASNLSMFKPLSE